MEEMEDNKIEALKDEFVKEYPEFISFMQSYGRPILTAVLVAVLVVMGIRLFSAKADASVAEAANALAQARDINDLENIVAEYGSTPTAPLAYMALAKAYFDSGNYDMALSKYMEFQSKFADHPFALAADLNRLSCLEARGQIQEAQMGYEAFARDHADHYLANEALFGKARCLETQGMLDEAKAVYEDYMVGNPGGAWFPRAEDALEELDRKIAAKSTPAEETEG